MPAQLHELDARRVEPGLEIDGPLQRVHRLVEPEQLLQHHAEIGPGVGVPRVERDRLGIDGGGLGGAAGLLEHDRAVVGDVRVVGRERMGAAPRFRRLVEAPAGRERGAEVRERLDHVGIAGDGASIGQDRVVGAAERRERAAEGEGCQGKAGQDVGQGTIDDRGLLPTALALEAGGAAQVQVEAFRPERQRRVIDRERVPGTVGGLKRRDQREAALEPLVVGAPGPRTGLRKRRGRPGSALLHPVLLHPVLLRRRASLMARERASGLRGAARGGGALKPRLTMPIDTGAIGSPVIRGSRPPGGTGPEGRVA